MYFNAVSPSSFCRACKLVQKFKLTSHTEMGFSPRTLQISDSHLHSCTVQTMVHLYELFNINRRFNKRYVTGLIVHARWRKHICFLLTNKTGYNLRLIMPRFNFTSL